MAATHTAVQADAEAFRRGALRGRLVRKLSGASAAQLIDDVALVPAPIGDRALQAAVQAVRSLQQEGPLGALSRFGDCVTMDPAIMTGNPVIAGTRLETSLLAAMHAKGFETTAQIAERYALPVAYVEAAIQFEAALAN